MWLRQIRARQGGKLVALIGRILEDGGEMIAASLLTATVVLAVVCPELFGACHNAQSQTSNPKSSPSSRS